MLTYTLLFFLSSLILMCCFSSLSLTSNATNDMKMFMLADRSLVTWLTTQILWYVVTIWLVDAALKVKLMVRRPHSQLVEQGIIPRKYLQYRTVFFLFFYFFCFWQMYCFVWHCSKFCMVVVVWDIIIHILYIIRLYTCM